MIFYFGASNGALKWDTNYVPKTSSNHQIKTGSILWTDFGLFFDRVKTDSRSFGSIGPKIVQITSTVHMTLRTVINELGLELRILRTNLPVSMTFYGELIESYVPRSFFRPYIEGSADGCLTPEWDFPWALTWFINSIFPFLRSWSINAPKCEHHQANNYQPTHCWIAVLIDIRGKYVVLSERSRESGQSIHDVSTIG